MMTCMVLKNNNSAFFLVCCRIVTTFAPIKIMKMRTKLNIEGLRRQFVDTSGIQVSDLYSFYSKKEPGIKQSTIYLRIKTLVKSGVLQRIGRGQYHLGKNEVFIPQVTRKMKDIEKIIGNKFLLTKYCQWELSCVNQFSQHLINFNVQLVDVERDVLDSMYYALKEKFSKVMLVGNLYDGISEFKDTIIVRPLISEAPTQKSNNTYVATLEKVLVDLATDAEFISFQGNEIYTIFRTAFKKYTLNRNTMLRYATRKHKKEIIEKIIEHI